MKFLRAFALLILAAASVPAQVKSPPAAPAAADAGGFQIESLQDLVTDLIDPDVLRLLNELDDQTVQKAVTEWLQAMKGTNIYQLTTLRETARKVIPVLQKFEETAPYGDWLQSRLDYLEAAQEMERRMKAANPRRNPALPLAAPTIKLERQVWTGELAQRPWPAQAKNYVPQLKAAFLAERVPPELVWLAEVESSFQARARSPAGAAGMFQLMSQTAKDEHLSLWPWDERLQPEKSAHAAARYLRTLHNHYGDWQLALAAYNVGAGRVDKLLKQQKAHSFEAIAGRLPVETQMYVPKVEATVRKREGRELQDLKAP